MTKEDSEEVTIITTKDKIQTYIRQNYVSKKLIQDKIKELEGQEDWYREHNSLDDLYGRIDELKELLEE